MSLPLIGAEAMIQSVSLTDRRWKIMASTGFSGVITSRRPVYTNLVGGTSSRNIQSSSHIKHKMASRGACRKRRGETMLRDANSWAWPTRSVTISNRTHPISLIWRTSYGKDDDRACQQRQTAVS
jgi:hypothetical protein